jgi:hypothetical protein
MTSTGRSDLHWTSTSREEENRGMGISKISLRNFVLAAASISGCLAISVSAQSPAPQDSSSGGSWTSTTESKEDYAAPTITTQSHTQSGDRSLDVRTLQTRASDGTVSPYQDIETETVQVNPTTTRTTIRTFVRDVNGAKTLFQITNEEKQSLPNGDSKVVRATSNPDVNGNLQLIQREVQETAKTAPGAEETKTTVLVPNANGGLSPSVQSKERKSHRGDTTEVQKTTLLSDGNGGWQVGEVKHETIKDDGHTSAREEDVSRPDSEGNLAKVSRTVSKEAADASGKRETSEETYSVDVPGAARDNNLHLVQRTTTSAASNKDGQQIKTTVEGANPGNLSSGLQVTTVDNQVVRVGPAGAQATRTIQTRGSTGSLSTVFVDIAKSNNAHAVEVEIPPAPTK